MHTFEHALGARRSCPRGIAVSTCSSAFPRDRRGHSCGPCPGAGRPARPSPAPGTRRRGCPADGRRKSACSCCRCSGASSPDPVVCGLPVGAPSPRGPRSPVHVRPRAAMQGAVRPRRGAGSRPRLSRRSRGHPAASANHSRFPWWASVLGTSLEARRALPTARPPDSGADAFAATRSPSESPGLTAHLRDASRTAQALPGRLRFSRFPRQRLRFVKPPTRV